MRHPVFSPALLAAPLLAAALLSPALPAAAQQAQPAEAQPDAAVEEIVVVGSLIRRGETRTTLGPVTELGAQQWQAHAAAQPVDVLKELTINTGSNLAVEQNNLQGTSQFSLRGLGLSSTLVLLNGRRAGVAPVSPGAGHAFFDINTLPLIMVERIDVLRDGASAIYGSQAVAGVANIVTRSGFEGFEVEGGFRNSTNTAYDLGLAFGHQTERGGFNLYASHYGQDENFRSDFPWHHPRVVDPNGDGNVLDGSFDTSRGSPGTFQKATGQRDSAGRYTLADPAPRFADPDCNNVPGAIGVNSTGRCAASFVDQRTIIAAEDRYQVFAEGDYEINNNFTFFAEAGFSNNEVTDRVGNLLLFRGNTPGNLFYVPAEHPFNFFTDNDNDGTLEYVNPADWTANHQAVPVGYFGRPLGAEANGDAAAEERRRFESFRFVTGADLTWGESWRGSGHFMRAKNTMTINSERHWVANRFAEEIIAGRWNPFGTRLANPGLVTPKTRAQLGRPASAPEPNDVAANDAETFRRFAAVKVESAESEQKVAEFIADGDAFQVGDWGMLQVAVGSQYRALDYAQTPDPLNAAGEGPQDGRDFAKAASQDSWALFGEALLPVNNLAEVQFALRHESYDKAGDTTDGKLAVRAFAQEWLELRGSYVTSFQAPSVFQTAGNVTSGTLDDPFVPGEAMCNPNDNNDGGNFITVQNLQGGNLKPQTAQSYNLGFIVKALEAMQISVDYWDFDYEDVVAEGQSFQDILDQSCAANDPTAGGRVVRDSSGQLASVTSEYVNVAQVKTRGLDFIGGYAMDSPVGDFHFNLGATLITQFDVKSGPDAAFTDNKGSRNFRNGFGPTPELRANTGVRWQLDNTSASLTLRYIDSYKNDQDADAEIESWTTVDAGLSHTFSDLIGRDEATTLSFGINNLFDRDPPCLTRGGGCNRRPGYDGNVHDIRGRIISLRIGTRFGG